MKKIANCLAAALCAALITPSLAVDPAQIDWGKIPAGSLTLFYPGQASQEWLLSAKHPGSSSVKSNITCVTCHKGAEKKLP